ncbi:hypothetical protein BUALT_Bualt10G0114400 [Buddleja alternifolia]|uniref:Uncharacterized protein n=1 Tax=Buddleja alternifolia TaxID=168488 RepID=A0AAV6X558_9LAMI|nr:hypothetical protein BUALT_Bualt10G0114400 [Buddleja alternifolia]
MDKSIVAVEESQRRSDSAACASTSLGSLVHIKSIAIDITSAMEETESPAHEHFSIRGFVAGMREKDRNMCLPFVSEGNDGNLVDYLPPLFVPRFRWWQCGDCVPDIATERSTEAVTMARRSDVGTSSCNNVNGGKDGLFLHNKDTICNKYGSKDYGAEEDNVPINSIMRNSNLRRTEGHTSVTYSKDKTDFRDKEARNPCADIPEANPPLHIRERSGNIADAADVACVAVRPSCIVDEPDNASSGSDGTKNALPPRRKPKLRSLADIMVEKGNPACNNNPGPQSASSSGMLVTYTEAEAVLPPQLELDAPADVAKGARSPQRKRKFILEEEKVIYPGSLGKRFKGVMVDGEKAHKGAEISESELEGNASVRLDLQFGVNPERVKPRKSKALDVSKKMRQQSYNEDGTVLMRELNKMNDANLQKHAVSTVPSETSLGNSRHAPSTLGEMGPYFSSFLWGHEFERISHFSKSKRPEVEVDHDCPMPPPSKSILGDCSSKGKVALDLSLNTFVEISDEQSSLGQHRSIPDLNETFPHQTTTVEGNQLSTLSDRSLPLNNTLDVSASCSKEIAREGKRQLLVSEPQNTSKNIELGGASDDIPMEIVELLAKNKLERARGNSRKHHLLPEGINNSFKGTPALYLDERPSMIGFPPANRRSDVTITNGNMGIRQNIPINCPTSNNRQLEMGKLEESQFRLFAPSQQRKTQYSASSSIMTRPRATERAELLWLPRRENEPFHLNIPQNHPIQTNSMHVHSFSDLCPKGKTISDIKGREGKKGVHGGPMIKDGVVRSSSTSLDPYSNETITAMQLLSLMDQGIVSGSSFKEGPKSFLNKPFSPCNHHPRLNGNENQKSGSFFSQNSNYKGFLGQGYGVYCSGESSKKASSYIQGQVPPELGNFKATHLEGPSNLVIRPAARSDSALGVCTLNQNPADFSIPDATNEFTISAKDLKSRKRYAPKEKPRFANVDGRKKQRARNYAPGKEYSKK